MKKFLYTISILIFIQNITLALDIVYPKQEYFKLNSPSTFFVGSVQKGNKLYINNKEIPVHKTGAFAQFVNLNFGKNEFTIKDCINTKKYIIERISNQKNNTAKFIPFNENKTAEIIRDNVPIRSSYKQFGINRISHFQKGLKLKVIGEFDDMYKIELSPVENAWIAKNDVKINSECINKTFLYDYRKRETNNEYIYEFALSDKTPYSIKEDNDNELTLKIYNVSANKNDTAIFKFILNQRIMGYNLKYDGDVLALSIKKEPQLDKLIPLKGIKIVVDAGHGGKEPGAISCCHDYEKDFNLSMALYLEKFLKEMGADVYMTRSSDKFVSLEDRVKYTNDINAQIFISIHANSLPDNANPQNHRGSSVYYYYNEAKLLSEILLNTIFKEMNMNIENVNQASFAVVRNTSAVSVLVESAYVINPDDNELLMQDDFRKAYAKTLANGIKNYVWYTETNNLEIPKTKKIKFIKIS
ncbi:N-acetylmuramoyl-L-alanine amidase [bacterium]|nr:N-acetylmuramoyl-L-alanine amidase [bacterium]